MTAAIVFLCLFVGVSGATAANSTDVGPYPQVETPTEENETQQENPERIDNGEYDEETAAWLAQRLGGRLSNGTVAISNGQYEQAQDLLGEEYDSRLDQYIDVTGTTDSPADNTSASEFQAARDNQRALTNQLQRYQTQYSEYQEARENGNEQRARMLARQMERTAANVSSRSQRLIQNYERIENTTSADVTVGVTRINQTASNITTRQREVREETLVGTTLTVESRSQTASFSEPATIAGELRTENGSVPAIGVIQLRIGNQTQNVTIDSTGSFETQYRPRTARLGTQRIRVAYVPAVESVYLTDTDNITVEIAQTTPDISVSRDPQVVSYGDEIAVSATVTADSIGVEGVPVEILIGNESFGRMQTASNGSASSTIQLPATIDNGDETLSARIPYQNRAITGVNDTAPLVVAQTQTTLSLNASATDGEVTVRGQLRTAAGLPVSNASVRVGVGNASVQIFETNRNGVFEGRIADLPATGGQVTARAQYVQPSSNLGTANATSTVTIQADSGGAVPPPDPAAESVYERLVSILFGNDPSVGIGSESTGQLWLLAGVASLVLTSGIIVAVSRFDLLPDQAPDEQDVSKETAGDEPVLIGPEIPDELPETAAEDLDARLTEYLEMNEYDAAVILAYSAVHEQLTTSHDIPESATHWELLEHCEQNGYDGKRVAAVQDVVEAFERAAFSTASLDADRAHVAVESARSLRQ